MLTRSFRASVASAVTPLLRTVFAATLAGLALGGCGSAGPGSETLGEQSSAITPISGCDYSFARPAPSSLVSMGYHFAARYLSGDPGSGKDITASEASGLEAAGLDIVLVWETTGMDATSGYNQGVSDATGAKSEAASVGEPATRPIYFAIDFDATSADASSINAYFQGVASVLGVSRTGVYGGYYIVDELFNAGLIKWAWQTYAWSGGSWDSRAQVRQTQNGVDGDQLDADEGMAADYGQWGPNGPSGTAEYAAQFVSQSFPLATTALAMVEGQTIPSYIELKNVGTKTWDSNTRIGTTQPRDRTSVFADSGWLAPDRPAGVTGTVAPGASYKFQFNLHAPATTGTYDEFFGVVEEGAVWFSDPGQGGPADSDLEVKVTVTAAEYAATFDSQTFPLAPNALTMNVGDEVQGSMTLTNTGTKPWVAGTTKLAPIPRDAASPFATSTWLSTSRVSSVPIDVQPGQKGTFPVSLKATTVGDFEVTFGLVEDGLVWFADAPLGGGPADGFLRVHLTVVADGAPDGGAVTIEDAGAMSDAGMVVDASIDTDAGGHHDAGHDAGHDAAGKADGGAAGDDGATEEGDASDTGTSVGSTGGCNLGAGETPPLASFALLGLGLALVARRKRSAKKQISIA
jgi:MYXO-CTERM domain-containing protein